MEWTGLDWAGLDQTGTEGTGLDWTLDKTVSDMDYIRQKTVAPKM